MFTTDQPVTGPAKSHPTCAGYARQSTVLSLILKLLSLFTICHILYYVLAVWKLVSTQMLLLQQVNCELLEHFAQSITQQFSYRWLLFFMHAWIMSSNFWDVNSLLWQSVCVCVRALCDLLGRYDFLLKVIIHRACKGLREYSDTFGFMPRFFLLLY